MLFDQPTKSGAIPTTVAQPPAAAAAAGNGGFFSDIRAGLDQFQSQLPGAKMTPEQKQRSEFFNKLAAMPQPQAQFTPVSFGGGRQDAQLLQLVEALKKRGVKV